MATQIGSPQQLSTLLSSARLLVVHFYKGSTNTTYEQLADSLSDQGITFTKVDVDAQTQIAQSYNVANPPTFIIFKNGRQLSKVNGNNPQQLQEALMRLAFEAQTKDNTASGGEGSSSGSGAWLGASLPKGYGDLSEQVDVRGLDLLNADSFFGGVRTLFEKSEPSTIGKGKGTASDAQGKDWVESDVDEQLMLYIPFTATVKVHTIQITSLPRRISEDDDITPDRPKTIHLYTNRQHNLGFEEAEEIPATQTIELKESDWDEQTGTAKLELRFVKFQNISSLVLFVVDGEAGGERTRIDRIRIIGEAGEKRNMGKLEKVGDDS